MTWNCTACGGLAANFTTLRRVLRADFAGGLWRASSSTPLGRLPCPGCRQAMHEVRPLGGIGLIRVCRPCQFAWFERDGFARCPRPRPLQPDEKPLAPEAARELAMAEAREQERRFRGGRAEEAPDEWWQTALGALGVPVLVDAPPPVARPWATWTVTALMVAATLACLPHLRSAVSALGFVPAEPWRDQGLTLISGFLLHAGLVHLAGNACFLLMLGGGVEGALRWPRYLALLLAAALGGDLVHALLDPRSSIPCVGASGGIAGVIAFYACAFPRARLAFCFRLVHWWRVPVWAAFAFWVLLQSLGAWQQALGLGSVSSLAHLGGAAVGVAAWLAWKALDQRVELVPRQP